MSDFGLYNYLALVNGFKNRIFISRGVPGTAKEYHIECDDNPVRLETSPMTREKPMEKEVLRCLLSMTCLFAQEEERSVALLWIGLNSKLQKGRKY